MKTKKRENKKTTTSIQPKYDSEIAVLIENSDHCLLPIVAFDGRIVGVITDPDICARATRKRQFDSMTNANLATSQVFPCKTNDEVREALSTTLNCSKVEVEVAGGILRHHHSW